MQIFRIRNQLTFQKTLKCMNNLFGGKFGAGTSKQICKNELEKLPTDP